MATEFMDRFADSPSAGPALPALNQLRTHSLDVEALELHNIVGLGPRDRQARPFSLLRTQVAKKCSEQGWSVIGVTSAEPGAGKSFVSMNLAIALANVGETPVYLFDFDLVQASIGRTFGISFEHGISDFLAGEGDYELASLGYRIEDLNLAVFPTHPSRANTAQLLGGAKFTALIQAIGRRSEPGVVICDLPPVFANDDALIAVQQLDCYLMVVDCGRTTRRQLNECYEMLKPAPRLGTVLNRYEGGFADPYGYYSRAYSKYY